MLHVLVGATCNNNCIFCMEADRPGRQRHIARQSAADIRAALNAYPRRDEVLFTSGEPTLNPELGRYVRWARELGFRTIALISNGRRLAYRPYAEQLVRLGVNKFTLSVHGPEARLHDALTRSRGAFSQITAGLAHLAKLKRSVRLEVHTSTVVVKGNLPFVDRIYRRLANLQVDRLCFNVLMLKGRGAAQLRFLMPRYRQIASQFETLAAELDPAARRRISLADIPRCTVAGLPFDTVGDQERFDQFERVGSLGIAELRHEDLAGQTNAAADRLIARGTQADLVADDRYYMTTRELKDDLLRIKGPQCPACRHAATCPGVWRTYVQHYGWEEFVPVQNLR